MVLLPHLFHPEAGDLVSSPEDDSLWRQRLPEASQTQEARTTTPRIQGASSRARACVVMAKWVGRRCTGSWVPGQVFCCRALYSGNFGVLAQVRGQEELVLGLRHLLTSCVGQSPKG